MLRSFIQIPIVSDFAVISRKAHFATLSQNIAGVEKRIENIDEIYP